MRLPERLTWLIVLGLVFTTILPVVAAIVLARQQSAEAEGHFALGQARSALLWSEKTGDQLRVVVKQLGGLTTVQACSPDGLDLMRRLDLGSTLLQGVGWIEGDALVCSSFGGRRTYPLHSPTYVSSQGNRIWTDVRLVDPGAQHVIVQSGHAAAVVHKDLALSFVGDVPGARVTVFSPSSGRVVLERGGPVPRGLLMPPAGNEQVRHTAGETIGLVRSSRFDLAAVAIIPHSHTADFVRRAAWVLLPVGAFSAMVLSLLFLRIVRMRLSMRSLIRAGLDTRRFRLVYQPLIDLATREVVAVEALMRWDRGKQLPISPEVFIPVAEEGGLIGRLTSRAFEILASDASAITALVPQCQFAVNLSASDLLEDDLVERMERWSLRSGVALERLVIEATERVLIDPARSADALGRLRERGVRIAIDEFGTGYSSLAYLAQLDIDYLKIDKLFIQALGTSAATNEVASAIVQVARQLGVQTIAEGIETAEQAEQVRAVGADFGQGYHFARPMALPDLLDWLRAGGTANSGADGRRRAPSPRG